MQKYYFMAGFPRSGSTLLSAILNQNPNIHSEPSSPVCGIMYNAERSILLSEQYTAYPKPVIIPKVINGILENYYQDVTNKIIIDKSKEWIIPEYFDVLLRNLDYEPKIIVTTRDILDILASFIHLVSLNNPGENFIDQGIMSRQDINMYRDINDIRCDHLMRSGGTIDNILYGMTNVISEKNKKYFHIIEYENLVNNTEQTIKDIYKFLDIEEFKHNFDNIKHTKKEDDTVFGLLGQHDVRPTISKQNIDKSKVLSKYILNKYSNLEFWRTDETSL